MQPRSVQHPREPRARATARPRPRASRPILVASLGIAALCGVSSCGDDAVASPDAELVSKAEARALRDATVWAPEVDAQRHEVPIIAMWDRLRGSSDKLAALAEAPFASLSLPRLGAPEPLEHGVARRTLSAQGEPLDREAVRALAQELAEQGYVLHETEWHHARFEPASGDRAAHSRVSFALHATRAAPTKRLILRGKLDIDWDTDDFGGPVPGAVVVSELSVLQRDGAPVFEELAAWAAPDTGPRPGLAEPILLHDLDGDGFTDIVLANANRVQFNLGDGGFRQAVLCEPELPVDAALLADFDGDGAVDLFTAANDGLPQLFTRRENGVFVEPREVTAVRPALKRPMAITAGDIDGDGDLDVFLAQYKLPYVEGQMPTPFYDANDGWHAYLLVNDGDGGFVDATQSAGLAPKRLRRTYSASFTDLDDDADLDLLVVSDFAGFDMYLNDGAGHFTDVTAERFGAGHDTFGMSHVFTDANADGKLDFLVVGMSSTTARRLDSLGLGRDDARDYRELRATMGYGNRLYLNQGGGRYVVAPDNDSLARTGWSWGVTSFDLENDGDRELYVVNGHISGESAQDYCSTFWTHDIYDGSSDADPEALALFTDSLAPLSTGRASWNGYEKNALLQRMGDAWVSTGFLFGVAHAYDSRAAASVDVDNDGRSDLVIVERTPLPDRHDVVHVYANRWPDPGNWLGVRLSSAVPGVSVLGATITLRDSAGRVHLHRVTSGDSHRSQHDSAVVFGLGDAQPVRLEVLWPGGRRNEIAAPELNAYVHVDPSGLR